MQTGVYGGRVDLSESRDYPPLGRGNAIKRGKNHKKSDRGDNDPECNLLWVRLYCSISFLVLKDRFF